MPVFRQDFARYAVVGLAVIVLAAAAWVTWHDSRRAALQPSVLQRPFLPRTARLSDLTIAAPAGWRVSVDSGGAWVLPLWPSLGSDEIGPALRVRTARPPDALAAWAADEAECATRPEQCRVRRDTVGSVVVVCRETAGLTGTLASGEYIGACRIEGGTAMAVYPCDGASCEALHDMAVATLGSDLSSDIP